MDHSVSLPPGRLPVEVYSNIFCHLSKSQPTLRAIRLVSSTFKREVRPFIRVMAIITHGTINERTDYIRRIVEHKDCAQLIRVFRFNASGKEGLELADNSTQAQEFWELLREALRCMEQLEHVLLFDLSSSWTDSGLDKRQAINLLEGCTFQKLVSLRIDSPYEREIPLQFLAHLTSIPS